MQELPPQYNPKEVEDKIYRIWEESGFFNPDKLPGARKKKFSIAMAPPNVTGSLHMGHALEYTLSDILTRKKRMGGLKTLWLPGTDHAGIATQNAVEKELKKAGIGRQDLTREKFLEKIWEWKEKYGGIIADQLKTLGVSADWSRFRFTMDPEYQEAVAYAFLHYYKEGWIYRAERVVNWCPRCATSLSDLELEYREAESTLYYINYPLADGSGIVTVATTRPETMLGDTAIAVHPNDKRYKRLVGKETILPLKNRRIPIVGDKAVDPNFGTGAVKVTPAHDLLDAEIAERHELPALKVIGINGRMTQEAEPVCVGLTVFECRKRVVEDLRAQKFLEREEPYTNNVALCYRCSSRVEPLPSMQWFLKMDKLASSAIKAVKSGRVRFHPKRWEKVYFDWLKNVKDWCISRQIWWGHRLPVYFCRNKQEGMTNDQLSIPKPFENWELKIENSSAAQYVISSTKPKYCPLCKKCSVEQAADVLDTWFSSALWPLATLGWPKKTKDLKLFYPTDVNTNDRGIINLWDARMIFSGMEFMKRAPFRDLLIHATILTREGKRMSKSLGTGIDPMDLISRYGADATRFGLIWQAMGNQDIRWSEEHVVAGKKFANKIWNSARFVLMQLHDTRNTYHATQGIKFQTAIDKKIVKALEKTKKEVDRRLEKYEFGQALHTLYDFYWREYCDFYLEESKKHLNPEVLFYVLAESLKLLHPFMPFITEEIWSRLPIRNKSLLIIEKWPK